MSYLNITRNLFLEKEELVKFQEFMANDISQQLFLKNSVTFGVVVSDFVNNTDFKVEVGSNSGTIKIDRDSYALDSDGNLIHQVPIDNVSIPNDGQYYWIRISHKYDNIEVGSCSIDADGIVSGIGTLFTSVLRGHSTDVPTKIMFIREDGTTAENNQIYEVVDVLSDTTAHLTAGVFIPESGLKVIVIGTTPISEFVTATQMQGLYKYDSCILEVVGEETPDTPPTINYYPNITFYLARVVNNGGTITVTDKRTDYWMFNVPGLKEKLAKASNLSDLENLVTARTNLSVYSKAEIDTLIGSYFTDSGWITMTRGTVVETTNYDVKIRRRGSLVVITGRFKPNSSITANSVVFSVPFTQIGADVFPTTRVYTESNEVSAQITNYGVRFYIDPPVGGDTSLQVKVLSGNASPECIINMSFILG